MGTLAGSMDKRDKTRGIGREKRKEREGRGEEGVRRGWFVGILSQGGGTYRWLKNGRMPDCMGGGVKSFGKTC